MSRKSVPTRVADRIAGGFRLPHEAASTGMALFALLAHDEHARGIPPGDGSELRDSFLAAVHDARLEDVCERLAEYAVRLAASPGLLDEERLKVVSLCDELCALEELGLPFPNRGSFVAEMTEHLSKARGRYEPFARADALRDTFWHRQLLRSSTATKGGRPPTR
ncbi:MAG: hypothetical protein GX593_02770 [Actinomycetales bacterium]|nr:hypothetical protein [Actinomycetales bacterium]